MCQYIYASVSGTYDLIWQCSACVVVFTRWCSIFIKLDVKYI